MSLYYLLATALDKFFGLLETAICIYCLLSWIVPASRSRWLWSLYDFLERLLYPVLAPARAIMSRLTARIGIDFSPIIAVFLLNILRNILVNLVYTLFGY